MKIGFNKINITPNEPVYMAGYSRTEKSKGILDAIEIHSLVWQIDTKLLVLIVLDAIMLEQEFCDDIKSEVLKHMPVERNNIMVCCTHTHSAPAFFKLTFENTIVEKHLQEHAKQQMIQSAIQSYQSLTECFIQFKSCMIEGLYGNRNIKEGWSDKSINVLEFYNQENALLYSLINISVHPTILNGQNALLSGDLLGAIRQKYALLTNAPAMITNGTTGDVSTRFYRNSSGLDELEYVSDEVIKQMKDKLKIHLLDITNIESDVIQYITHSDFSQDETTNRILNASLDKKINFLKERCQIKLDLGNFDLVLFSQVICIGNLFIITLPGDVVSAFGKQIKESLPEYQVFIICYANTYCNYLVNEEQYGLYFETFNSRCNRGEADKFINKVIELAQSMI